MANTGRLAGAEGAVSKRTAGMETRLTAEMRKRAERLGLAFNAQTAVGVAEDLAKVRAAVAEAASQWETAEDAAEALAALDTLRPGAGFPSLLGVEVLARVLERVWGAEPERGNRPAGRE